jgi:hypothetical protein
VPPRPYPTRGADPRERRRPQGVRELDERRSRRPRRPGPPALLHGGEVAVKVQYPDIEDIVRSDLRTLRRILGIVQHFVPYQGLDDVYREIRAIVISELDFRAEADHGDRVAANFEGRSDVAFPKVVRELSTERMLVTHFEPGCKISDVTSCKLQGSTAACGARWSSSTASRFTDGVYHADPHPGTCWSGPTPAAPPGSPRSCSSTSARWPPSRRSSARASSSWSTAA